MVARSLAGSELIRTEGSQAMGNPPSRTPFTLFVPGRIEVLGKHTDYAGGRSLLVATEQGLTVRVRPRTDGVLRVRSRDLAAAAMFEIGPEIPPAPGHWSDYFRVTARRLARDFALPAGTGAWRGADVALTSDLPPAAGLSTSSALVVAAFEVLARVNALREREEVRASLPSPGDLASYLGAVENGLPFLTSSGALLSGGRAGAAAGSPGQEGVGTFGGSEDHTAILCSTPGALRCFRFRPVRLEALLSIPRGHRFAVAASGVVAAKTGAAREAYNRLSLLAGEAAALWSRESGHEAPHLAAAVAMDPESGAGLLRALARGRHPEAEAPRRRVEHFLLESEGIVPAACQALAEDNLEAFGRLVDRSQAGAEELLGNQVPETVFLAREARRLGAVAASAFGAGFGGSVWALVPTEHCQGFLAAWSEGYHRAFPEHRDRSRFFHTQAAGGAREIPAPGPAADGGLDP